MRKSRRIFVIVVTLFIGIGAASIILPGVITARRASSFLKAIGELSPYAASPAEGVNIAKKWGATQPDCVGTTCTYWITFTNPMLQRTGLAPATMMRAMIRVDGIAMREITLEFWLGEKAERGRVILIESFCASCPQQSRKELELRRDTTGTPQLVIARLRPQSSQDLRERALRLNVNCFGKIGGCKNAAEMAPALWALEDANASLTSADHRQSH